MLYAWLGLAKQTVTLTHNYTTPALKSMLVSDDDSRCETSGNDTIPPDRQSWIVKSRHESEQKSRTQNGGIA